VHKKASLAVVERPRSASEPRLAELAVADVEGRGALGKDDEPSPKRVVARIIVGRYRRNCRVRIKFGEGDKRDLLTVEVDDLGLEAEPFDRGRIQEQTATGVGEQAELFSAASARPHEEPPGDKLTRQLARH
jgi:hypothetical protein